jgi:hypothetical protein
MLNHGKLVTALLMGLMSLSVNAASVIWTPTNTDVNYISLSLDSGYSLAMFDVDDFDASKVDPLMVNEGNETGGDTILFNTAGSNYTATSTKPDEFSGDSITLLNDNEFVIALTDNLGSWFEPTGWTEDPLNVYQVTFDNGSVVSVDAVPTVIPVPPAVWLFGSGLIGLVGIARRKNSV